MPVTKRAGRSATFACHTAAVRTSRRARSAAIAVAAGALAIAACTGDDSASPTTPAIPGVPDRPVVTVDADADPFCDAIVSLDGRAGDEPADAAEVLAVYDSIADDAPPDVAADFDIVRDGLRSVVAGQSVSDPEALDAAAEELSIWVDLVCRSTDRSPLPPPTQPGAVEDASG